MGISNPCESQNISLLSEWLLTLITGMVMLIGIISYSYAILIFWRTKSKLHYFCDKFLEIKAPNQSSGNPGHITDQFESLNDWFRCYLINY